MEEKKLKIAFIISSFSHGKGGHYYSLRITAESLLGVIDPIIVCTGTTSSPVLDGAACKVYNVLEKSPDPGRTVKRIRRIFRDEQPDVIHAFDMTSLFFARLLSHRERLPLLATKTAGPDPIGFWPIVPNMVLYSEENRRWFESHPTFSKTQFFMLPARALPVEADDQRIATLGARLPRGEYLLLMRIARINERYHQGFQQAIRLTETLNRLGIPATLAAIGAVESQQVLEELQQQADPHVVFLTGATDTLNAAALLPAADVVIGNGRSIMEASSLGKVLMTTAPGQELPLLINDQNFRHCFDYNFELRSLPPATIGQPSTEETLRQLGDPVWRNTYSGFSHSLFNNYFDIRQKKEEYLHLYTSLRFKKNRHPLNLLRHFSIVLKMFLKRTR